MLLVTHPTGNQNVRWLLSALQAAGLLTEFVTTLAIDPRAGWLRLVPRSLQRELLRRSYPTVPLSRVRMHPWREIARLASGRCGRGALGAAVAIDAIYRDLDASVARRISSRRLPTDVRGVYAYEDGAVACFRTAETRGLKRIYELPIAYWGTSHTLLEQEAERLPGWRATLGAFEGGEEKATRKEAELRLAEMVVCPSRFVIDSLPGWARGKTVVLAPFGSPEAALKSESARDGRSRPLRVLFVGSLSQRKGLGDLFAAMKRLQRSDVELVVMGSLVAPLPFYRRELPDFIYEPPRAHGEVLALMQSCDVLVLPSIVEGRALVLQEAMSQGVPLVITANTGGADLIEQGRTGFLVPIRDPAAIARALDWMADHREETAAMGRLAKAKAATYTWSEYGKTIADAIDRLFLT